MTVFKDNNPSGGPLGATWGADGTIVYAGSGRCWIEAGLGWGWRGRDADDARPGARRGQTLQTRVPAGRPGVALHDRVRGSRARRRPDCRVGPGDRRKDCAPHRASRAVSAVRPPRVWNGGHAPRRRVRPRAADRGRSPSAGPRPGRGARGQGAYEYDVADDGTIVYLSANVAPQATRTLVWVDRQGRETPLGAEAHPYVHPRLAPDGTRVAVLNAGNIWIWDLARARLTAGTLDGGSISIWTPDSARLIFSSIRGGGSPNLYVQAADGTGTATRLTDSPNQQQPDRHHPGRHSGSLQRSDTDAARRHPPADDDPDAASEAARRDTLRRARRRRVPGRPLAGVRVQQIGCVRSLRPTVSDRGSRSVAGLDRRRNAAALGAERAGALLRGA